MKFSRKATIPLIAATMLFGSSAFSDSAVIQKWVDAEGHVHFGDMPPPDAKTSDVTVKYGPTVAAPAPKAAPAAGGAPGAAPTAKPGTMLDELTKARLAKEAKEAEDEKKQKEIEANAARVKAEACNRQRAGILKNQLTSNKDECS